MAFPTSPTNGSTAVVNGIVYLYNSADNAWTRFSSPPGNLTVTGNLTSSGNLIASNLSVTGNLISSSNLLSNNLYVSSLLSIGEGVVQQDVLNLNNNNLYNVNTIRINDPGTSEGIAWEGGSGWNIYESPNDLSNNIGNLQIVLDGTRVFTVDTNQTVNIPSTRDATSTITGALTVGGGVGIAGNLWVGGNIYAANIIGVESSTISVIDPLLYLTATSPFPYNYDIGFFSHFVGGSGGNYQHTGFSRNYTDNTWTLFSNVFAEPGITIDWTEANIIFDPIKVGSANIANTTVSTSTTTGALVVGGGAGISGALYIANTGDVSANIGTLFLSDATTQANLGAFQLYANANIGTLFLDNATTQANLGTLYLGNISTQANLGSFQTYVNTAFVTSSSIDTLNANIGAFYTYANTKIGTNNNGNLVVDATTSSTSKTTGAVVVAGGVGISGNAYVDRLYTTQGLFWAGNGFVISTGGGGGGGSAAGGQGSLQFNDGGTFNGSTIIYDTATGNVVITDTTDSTSTTTGSMVVQGGVGVAGNVFANTIYTTTGIRWAGNGAAFAGGGGGLTYTSDTSPHALPAIGDQWYDTSTDILYEYIEDGTTEYWVDVQSPIFNGSLSTNLVGNLSITGNLSVARAFSATGNITTLANLNVLRSANIYGNILSGNIFVNKDATVVSNLTVSGYTIIANVVSSGNIITTGNISVNNVTVTNTISTGTIATGNLSVSGNVNSGLTVSGNVSAGNLVTSGVVSGSTTNTGTLTATGNVLFTGANVALGNVANLHIDGGTTGQFLQTDGNGTVNWQDLPLTSIQEFTATGGQTVFTIVGTYTVGTVLVFVNGIQMNTVDYTASSGTTVVLTEARIAGDTVRIVSSVGASSLSSGLVLSVTNTRNFAVAMSVAMGI